MVGFFISLDPGMDQIQSTLSQILPSLQSSRKKSDNTILLPLRNDMYVILSWHGSSLTWREEHKILVHWKEKIQDANLNQEGTRVVDWRWT